MRVSFCLLSKKNVFSSCVDVFSNRSKYWSDIDHLVNKSIVSGDSQTYSPESLLKLANKGLKYQIFDSAFWDQIHNGTLKSRESFSPTQWVQILHIYKRIKIRNSDLYNIALGHLQDNLTLLSLKDLSLLSLSFSYFGFCPTYLFSNIGKTVCSRYRDRKLKELEGIVGSNIDVDNNPVDEGFSKWSRLNDTVSYVHLVGAYAKCGYDHKELFEVASEEMANHLSRGDLRVAPNLIMKTLQSYSRFGYRHIDLLNSLSSQIVTSKLSNEDLANVKSIFDQLNYQNDTMDNLFSYRLGNAK